MWLYYSQCSRENATPSSGTSPWASYKEVASPPPPGALKESLGRVVPQAFKPWPCWRQKFFISLPSLWQETLFYDPDHFFLHTELSNFSNSHDGIRFFWKKKINVWDSLRGAGMRCTQCKNQGIMWLGINFILCIKLSSAHRGPVTGCVYSKACNFLVTVGTDCDGKKTKVFVFQQLSYLM